MRLEVRQNVAPDKRSAANIYAVRIEGGRKAKLTACKLGQKTQPTWGKKKIADELSISTIIILHVIEYNIYVLAFFK